MTTAREFCDRVPRRDFLRLGVASLFGMGIDLPRILAAEAKAVAPTRDISFIYLFLQGGVSTIDTFDLKPDAPAEFRGEFSPVDTNVPGTRICEHLPKIAQTMDLFSMIRSFRHHNSDHGAADHYMHTGHFPSPGFNPNNSPNNQRPAFGSVIAKQLGPKGSVPPYVALPKMHSSGGSAYLGAAAAPFAVDADPNAPNFSVPDILPPAAIDTRRLSDRRQVLADLDRYQKSAETKANRQVESVDLFQQKAFELMTSPAAKKAFDIKAESDKLRDAYGRSSLGQSCLMARRLVEAGVRSVTVDHSNWDTHDGNFKTLKNTLLPQLDPALSMLFSDLKERGLLETTLVVVSGEFGRTPRINKNAGRDHWGPGFTVLVGGGGIRGGRVVGSTDARAERPASDPYGPEDLSATAYTLLGIDPKTEFHTPDGRPMAAVNNGRIIRELV